MTELSPPTRRSWPVLSFLAWLGVSAAAAIELISLCWSDTLAEVGGALLTAHYAAFMCQTFTFHAAVAMLPVVVFAALARRHRLAIAAAIVFALGATPELRGLWTPRAPCGSGEVLKVMSINLMYGRGDHVLLLEQIEAESPDVLVFQEWTDSAARQLRADLRLAYPHAIEQPRDDAFGQAVFSKRAFVEQPRNFPPVPGFTEPQITFAVSLDDRPLRITNVHLLPPVGRQYFQLQRAGAARLAGWLADPARDDRADLLVGDFNATARSGTLSRFRSIGLTDAHAAAGRWRGSTWPRTGVLRFAPGIRLDHALVRDTVECIECAAGEDFGSDHRPVIVRIRRR